MVITITTVSFGQRGIDPHAGEAPGASAPSAASSAVAEDTMRSMTAEMVVVTFLQVDTYKA